MSGGTARRGSRRWIRGGLAALVVVTLLAALTVGLGAATTTRSGSGCLADVGISTGAEILGAGDAERDARLDRIAGLGATSVRVDVPWSSLQPREPRPGDDGYDPAAVGRMDAFLDAAHARGLTVTGILAYSPPWAAITDSPPGPHAHHVLPGDPWAMEGFARDAAARWSDRVGAWEIWNEPNLDSYAHPVDPVRYAALVRVVSAAVRSADPDVEIVAGALAGASDEDGHRRPDAFWAEALEAGIGPDVTAVSAHPYTYPRRPAVHPGASLNPFARGLDLLPRLAHVQERAGVDLPLWVTEYGAPTGHVRSMWGEEFEITEEQQAAWLRDAMRIAADRGVPRFSVYNDTDRAPATPDPGGVADAESHFGLVAHDGRARPAAAVLREVRC